MSAANCLLTEEQLLCCICLDVFTEPVTLPCGHNFCKNCITQHLNFNSQHQCPMCKERVNKKHKLGVNTFISEMAIHFRQSVGKKASNNSEQQVAKPGEVFYNVPTQSKWKTLRSWLLFTLGVVCLTIFFATNLKLHQTLSRLKTQLFDTVENTEDCMCAKHDKPLELYCQNEQMSICRSCADSSHRFHHIVSLKDECVVKKTELGKTEAKLQEMIQKRLLKIQEIKHSVKLSKDAADTEMADGVQVFTALRQSLEKGLAELIGMIGERQEITEKQGKGFIQELEQEISKLMRRRAEMEQLSHSEDHLHFLQNFPSLNTAPPTKDWTSVSICPVLFGRITRTAVVRAVDQLTETVRNEMIKLHEVEQKRVQQFAADVTLDPDTAHPALILSDDAKQVHCCVVWKKLPDNSKVFEPTINVLGKQSFSCGRFHYDVQVRGKTRWTLGVAKESVNRKGEIKLSPDNGFWTICLRNRKEYFALASHPAPLSVNYQPENVRVFVDYEEGLVSFYDIDAAALLYSFTGYSFTEKLYPFFSPGTSDGGRNSAPLIITPVNQHRLN